MEERELERKIRDSFLANDIDPRQADLAMARLLCKGHEDNIGDMVESIGEYIWDHLMGEPDEPTLELVTDLVENVFTKER